MISNRFNSLINPNEIEDLLRKYNDYITDSKIEVVEIIRSFDIDKYLIEKLRKIDKIDDVHFNDKETFETIFQYFKPIHANEIQFDDDQRKVNKNRLEDLILDIDRLEIKFKNSGLKG